MKVMLILDDQDIVSLPSELRSQIFSQLTGLTFPAPATPMTYLGTQLPIPAVTPTPVSPEVPVYEWDERNRNQWFRTDPALVPMPPAVSAPPETVPPPMPPLPPHVGKTRVFPAATNQPNQRNGAVDVLTGQPVPVPTPAAVPSHVAPPVIPSVMPVAGEVPLMPSIPPAVVNPMPPLPAVSAAAVKSEAVALYTSGPQGQQKLAEAMQRWSEYMGAPMTMSGLSDANAAALQRAMSEVSA